MSYYVYMLKSIEKKPVTYVGYTNNLKKRILTHNEGKGAKSTRGYKWKVIFKKKFHNKVFFGVKTLCIKESKLLGSSGALYNVRKKLDNNIWLYPDW